MCIVASVFTSTTIWAQTNSWIGPTSGKWEIATNWSLGVPPGSGQTVFVANPGFKAVAIDNTTAVNFPQTMTIGSLSVNSPGADSLNTVLMNFAGVQTPLNANSFIEVSNNANMIILQSAVQTGFFQTWPGGAVTEDVSSQVTASTLLDGGAYFFTNGTLTVPEFGSVSGQFVQAGGSNFMSTLEVTGDFDISGGQLVVPPPGSQAQNGILVFGDFVQSGGTVGDWLGVGQTGVGGGTYQLSGGLLQTAFIGMPAMSANGEGTTPDNSFMTQTGGTNIVASMDVGDTLFGNPQQGLGTYLLTNGMLINSGGITINGQGNFYQEGGVDSNTLMVLTQTELISETSPFTNYFAPAHYYLNGGTFTSANVSDQSSVFSQTGGSAEITTLTINGGQYNLTGGTLTVSTMSLTGGASFSQTGGTVTQTGTLTLDSSSITAGDGTQHFGQLLLSGSTNSSLTLDSAPSVLHFANSSGEAWSSTAMLLISNWNGSLSGGGEDQIFFGSDSTGLTSQQSSQIKFINPAGLPAGTYTAQILSEGEVVPNEATAASIAFSRQGNNLALTWPTGWVLQSATNVAGPYNDVTGATSPYTINTTAQPQQFFRLRQATQ